MRQGRERFTEIDLGRRGKHVDPRLRGPGKLLRGNKLRRLSSGSAPPCKRGEGPGTGRKRGPLPEKSAGALHSNRELLERSHPRPAPHHHVPQPASRTPARHPRRSLRYPLRRHPRSAIPHYRREPRPPHIHYPRRSHRRDRARSHRLSRLAQRARAPPRRTRPPARRRAPRQPRQPRPTRHPGSRQDPLRGPRRGAGDGRHLRLRRGPVAAARSA